MRFWLDQIGCDVLGGLQANFLNKAKNLLVDLIADGEAREYDKLYGDFPKDPELRGPDWDGSHRQGNQL